MCVTLLGDAVYGDKDFKLTELRGENICETSVIGRPGDIGDMYRCIYIVDRWCG